MKVTLKPGDVMDTRAGFSQGGIAIQAGRSYAGYLWVKVPDQDGYSDDIILSLEEDNPDGNTYASAMLSLTTPGDWRQPRFSLSPTTTDRSAKFSVLFRGRGTLYIDQVSLEPVDARNHVRPDSAEKIAELRPSFIRWPGGNVAQDYHWQWGVGPRDLRPIWPNRAWDNAPEPNDLGTDEYLAFCAQVRAQPSITVNVNGGGATPEEAAAWVEYVNGSAESKYGSMRAADGHPQPYGVIHWELGNEMYGDWVRGHVDAETYARSVLQYARAMPAADPHIKLIAVGAGDDWNTAVLKIAGPEIDYLAMHDYTSASLDARASDPRTELMTRPHKIEASNQQTAQLIKKLVAGCPIEVIAGLGRCTYVSQRR